VGRAEMEAQRAQNLIDHRYGTTAPHMCACACLEMFQNHSRLPSKRLTES
jgi:hypothetical protein